MNYNDYIQTIAFSVSEEYQAVAQSLNMPVEQLNFVALSIAIAILLSRLIKSDFQQTEREAADKLAARFEQEELLKQAKTIARNKKNTEEEQIAGLAAGLETILDPVLNREPLPVEPKEKLQPSADKSINLSTGLSTSRKGFFSAIKSLFGQRDKLSAEMVEELEMMLVSSDLGVATVTSILKDLRSLLKERNEVSEEEVIAILKSQVTEIMNQGENFKYEIDPVTKPHVLMIVGVNGAGKTTSIAKLANNFSKQGKKVLIAAADTFRAAAVEQIKVWGERLDIPVVSGNESAKPSAVVFDAMVKAKEDGADLLIVDTAGRLHTKTNLMQELEGIKNIMRRHDPAAPHDIFLVVDGTTGQNGLMQAKEFNEAAGLTGLIVTKLDGTSKGGIVVAIKKELGVPVRYIGVGEGLEDLLVFDPKNFAEALLSRDEQTVELSEHGAVRRRKKEGAGN